MWNDDQVKAKIRKCRNLPTNLKPEFLPTLSDGDQQQQLDDVAEIDIERLQLDMANATDKVEAQTIELKIRGLINAYKLQEAAGHYISRSKVNEAMIRVGSLFKAAIKRLEADLPPMLEGASPEAMQRMIGEKADEVLRAMQEEYQKMEDIGHEE